MKEYKKPFSYTLKVKEPDGKEFRINETHTGCGYRKSCFSTEKAARKSLTETINLNERFGRTVIDWTVTECAKIIDRMEH